MILATLNASFLFFGVLAVVAGILLVGIYHKYSKPGEQNVDNGGDDLGCIWYTFTNMSLVEVMEWINCRNHKEYKIIDVEVKRRFWVGRINEVFVIFEKKDKE